LTAGFLAIAAMVGLVGYLSGHTDREIQQQLERLSRSTIIKADAATALALSLSGMQVAAHAVVMEKGGHGPAAKIAEGTDRHIKEHVAAITRHRRNFQNKLEANRFASQSLIEWAREEDNLWMAADEIHRTAGLLDRLKTQFDDYSRSMDEFLDLLERNPSGAKTLLQTTVHRQAEEQLLPLIEAHRNNAAEEFTKGVRGVERAMTRARERNGVVTVIAVLVAVVLGLGIARSVARPLAALKSAAVQVSQGRWDVAVPVHSADEIGLLATTFNQMVRELQEKTALALQIAERKAAEQQLRASLAEKEVLLKEIHHRVKNNLQVISSLLNLQAHETADPEACRLLHESQGRIRSMALIHEQLYQSEDLARIDFAEYLGRLASHLERSLGAGERQIAVKLDVETVSLPLEQAIPCGMIVNELLTNAIQHGFPQGRSGEVRVQFRQENERLVLAVEDNGVGVPAGVVETQGTTLGLKVVRALVRQVHGEMTVEYEGGTRFKVSFGAALELQ
jgi:two-component sensor histidine kinase/HAMP domain-containing protein